MSSPARPLGPGFETWQRDDPRVREAVLSGHDVEVTTTSYAENDFILEFLMGSGLWDLLVSVKPAKLRKENGKSWRALNGLEVLRELAQVNRIARCGRVISDTRLMMIAGFNAEEIRKTRQRRGQLVTTETLGRHLARMQAPEIVETFYRHVRLLYDKKWIGPGIYAADGHEVTFPHARGWPGMGTVGEAYGYKLLLLIRVSPGPERIVGYALAPLQISEHRLLKIVLRQLQEKVAPVRKLIDVLVLDRGYWGAEFLLGLRKRYGFHFVTRAQHEKLGIVTDVEGLLQNPETAGQAVEVQEERSRLGKIKVRLRGFEGVPLRNERDREVGQANVTVAEEYDRSGNRLVGNDGEPRPRFYYVTSLPTRSNPYKIREHYLLRWIIENQGFRNLTQRWSLDIPAGRHFVPIMARMLFVFVLANAESVVAELFPGQWQEERQRLGRLGVTGLIGGAPSLAAYTTRGELGLLTPEEFEGLITQRERAAERSALLTQLRRAHARGEGLEDVLRRLAPPEGSQ